MRRYHVGTTVTTTGNTLSTIIILGLVVFVAYWFLSQAGLF